LFFAFSAKNKKTYPAGNRLIFICRPLNGKEKNILLCALCASAVKSFFIPLPPFIEQILSGADYKGLVAKFPDKKTERYLPSPVLPSALYKCSPSTLPFSFLNILEFPVRTSSTYACKL